MGCLGSKPGPVSPYANVEEREDTFRKDSLGTSTLRGSAEMRSRSRSLDHGTVVSRPRDMGTTEVAPNQGTMRYNTISPTRGSKHAWQRSDYQGYDNEYLQFNLKQQGKGNRKGWKHRNHIPAFQDVQNSFQVHMNADDDEKE